MKGFKPGQTAIYTESTECYGVLVLENKSDHGQIRYRLRVIQVKVTSFPEAVRFGYEFDCSRKRKINITASWQLIDE